MLGKKILLNEAVRKIISDPRKAKMQKDPSMTAENISETIGRTKSWLSQVENGRLKSVKTRDFVNAYCVIAGLDFRNEETYSMIADQLDHNIMFINLCIDKGICDSNGDVIDLPGMIRLQQTRDHLLQAGRGLLDIVNTLNKLSIKEIEQTLDSQIHSVFNNVVFWINRAFSDTAQLFSNEVSTRNLYFLIETSWKIYEGNYEALGLNTLGISLALLDTLKEKLNTDCFLKARSIVKPLNDYALSEIEEVVKNYAPEDYMRWKNKHIYIGAAPSPMLVGYIQQSGDTPHYVNYPDLSTATGLSEAEYLYIIKQLYDQFDIFYKKYKSGLLECEALQTQNDELALELQSLKENLKSLSDAQDDSSGHTGDRR